MLGVKLDAQKLPGMTRALSLDGMKREYMRSPLDLLNSWSCPMINSRKTFDYNKQTDQEVRPNCIVSVISLNELDSNPMSGQVEEAVPKRKRNSKKRRNRKRRGKKIPTVQVATECDTVDGCPRSRRRLPSECGSEDSFIFFEDCSDSACADEFRFDTLTIQNDSNSKTKNEATKTVRFASDDRLCEVHHMVKWSYAHRKARKGPWEQYALDRMRFKDRINNMEKILNYVLQPAHRRQIYNSRFKE